LQRFTLSGVDEAPEDAVPTGEMPAPKRALCEELLALLGLHRGQCRLTLYATDGSLRYVLAEEKISATALDRPPHGHR